MAYQYTNRKGATYYLHRRERKGKTRFVFCKQAGDGAVDALPAGYEVRESVNGQISVAQAKARVITATEEALVRKALPAQCRLEIKGREIIIFEPSNGAGGHMFQADPLLQQAIAALMAKNARYEPVLKFTLVDTDDREFEVTRWRYSGENGWLYPLQSGPLTTLAREFIPHIGEQSFFDLR